MASPSVYPETAGRRRHAGQDGQKKKGVNQNGSVGDSDS